MNSKNLADLLGLIIIAINNFFLFLLFLLIFQVISAFLFLILLIPLAVICVILTIIYLMIPNPSRLIKRAEVYLASNFNLLAIDSLDKALKVDPNNIDALILLCHAFRIDGQYNNAIRACKNVLEKEPNNIEVLETLGLSYIGKQDYDSAINIFEKLLHFEEKFEDSWINLIFSYNEKGEHNKALVLCKDMLNEELSKGSKNYSVLKLVWNSLARTYNHLGLFDKAIKAANQALEIDTFYYSPLCHRGYAYFKKGFFKKAILDIKGSLELDSDNPLAWFYLAQVYFDQGMVHEALNACDQSLKIYPKYKKVLDLRDSIIDRLSS